MAHLHWSFFEMIDEDLHEFSRQVEFAPDNFGTYSIHLARLYLSICSEVDVVAKLLCGRISPATKTNGMDDCRKILNCKYPNLAALSITVRPATSDLLPWKEWVADTNPTWWRSHNDVKHERNKDFKEANLGNVLNAASGLLVMLTYWYQPEIYGRKLRPEFRVLEIDRQYVSPFSFGPTINLPDFGPILFVPTPPALPPKI